MNANEFVEFQRLLDVVTVPVLSAFLDANGWWSKGSDGSSWRNVDHVVVQLVAGGPAYELTKQQAQSLSGPRLRKLKQSPSSPLP